MAGPHPDRLGGVRAERTPPTVTGYALTSANDSAGRDPKDWTLQGSADGQTWTDLDRRTGQTFPERFQTRRFDVATPQEYTHYRLNITANSGEPLIQLADLRLFTGSTTTPPEPPAVNQAVVDILDRQHPATRVAAADGHPLRPLVQLGPEPDRHRAHGRPGRGAALQRRGRAPTARSTRCRGAGTTTAAGRSTPAWATPRAATARTRSARTSPARCKWTTGIERGDCQATIAANYKVERLTAANQTGQLDQIGEPHGLTIAPDGTVFYVGKAACPSGPVVDWTNPNVGLGCGTIHSLRPGDQAGQAADHAAGDGQPGQRLRAGEERGGPARHRARPERSPTNGWLYVYWMPHDVDRPGEADRPADRLAVHLRPGRPDDRPGHPQGPAAVAGADPQLLPRRRRHGVRRQGQPVRRFRRQQLVRGVAAATPATTGPQEYQGISFQDARRTAGNTNDLNGKIVRIHPEADGTYTIPAGQPVPAGHREDPSGDLRDGRAQHRPAADRPGAPVAHRRLGRPGRRRRRAPSWARRSTRPPRSSRRPATRAGRTAWATGSRTATAATPTPRC